MAGAVEQCNDRAFAALLEAIGVAPHNVPWEPQAKAVYKVVTQTPGLWQQRFLDPLRVLDALGGAFQELLGALLLPVQVF